MQLNFMSGTFAVLAYYKTVPRKKMFFLITKLELTTMVKAWFVRHKVKSNERRVTQQ